MITLCESNFNTYIQEFDNLDQVKQHLLETGRSILLQDNKNIVGFETINSKLIILHYRAEEIGKYDKTKSSPK